MTCKLYISNDNTVTLEGLRYSDSGEYINNATVDLTLLDSDDVEIVGQSWPLTLTYVTSSNGNYTGIVDDAIEVENGDTGTALIEIDSGTETSEIELPVEFVTRDSTTQLWTSRSELERMFGLTNISTWADLDNTEDADAISLQIQWACQEATEEARLRLHNSPAHSLQCAPRTLRIATTRLAGVTLYESRGMVDVDPEGNGQHKLAWHVSRADTFFKRVQAGQLRLIEDATFVPKIVLSTETEEVTEDTWDPFSQ